MIETNYSEEFKKGTVRFRLAQGIGIAELEKKFAIDRKLLRAWDELYFKEVVTERNKQKKEEKKEPRWHRTGSISGYWK